MAQWLGAGKVEEGRLFSPVINCTVPRKDDLRNENTCAWDFWNVGHKLSGGVLPFDIGVEHFRRSPMDAILVALQARPRDEEDRSLWGAWVSIILGIPFNAWNCISALKMEGEVADQMVDRIPLRADLAKIFHELAKRRASTAGLATVRDA